MRRQLHPDGCSEAVRLYIARCPCEQQVPRGRRQHGVLVGQNPQLQQHKGDSIQNDIDVVLASRRWSFADSFMFAGSLLSEI